MKTKFLTLSVIGSLLLGACSSDDTADVIVNNNTGNEVIDPTTGAVNLSGIFSEDLTLEAGTEYLLNGALIMDEGATLTIPAGTTIKAIKTGVGAGTYIAISQGAKIMAEGTAAEPIVFTSNQSSPEAGDWGGLIILGEAPINSVVEGDTSTSEIANLPYGGTISDDNSGVLSYVRIEYSGGSADGSSENNGLSLYGVGNGTTIEFVQTFEGKDDGIEFFGGTVNASYLSVVNAQDDSIDWTEGYTGTITDAFVMLGAEHDKAIEADGFNGDIGLIGDFYSSPTVSNLTVIGLGAAADPGSVAMHLRVGTEATFSNVFIQGYEEGIEIDNDQTGVSITSGNLSVTDVTFDDVTTNLKNDTGVIFTEADFISGEGNGVETDYATWGAGWTR